MSTGFDKGSLENLTKLGIKRVKVPSGEITNTPFLEYIASLNLPIILSTGMSTLGEIEQALKTLNDSGAKIGLLLYCIAHQIILHMMMN